MSYPSITVVLGERGIDPETATAAEIREALLEAFHRDLKIGMVYLGRVAAKVKRTHRRLVQSENPNSKLGKQLIRLLGTDIARGIVEKRFGVAFGLYNC